MAAWTADLAVGASILLVGLSLSLAVLGFLAWRRLRAARLGLVALAFLALAVEGAVLANDAYANRAAIAAGDVANPLLLPGLNLLVVVLLYLSVLKR
jgi:hypothetical protein